MEGIETCVSVPVEAPVEMSVGAPTWRGLKLAPLWRRPRHRGDVSRCPDMEGIETTPSPAS